LISFPAPEFSHSLSDASSSVGLAAVVGTMPSNKFYCFGYHVLQPFAPIFPTLKVDLLSSPHAQRNETVTKQFQNCFNCNLFQAKQNTLAVKRFSFFSQSLVGIRCLSAKPEAGAVR